MKSTTKARRPLAVGAVIALGLQLSGCNAPSGTQNTAGTNSTAGEKTASALKVALLTPGDINDHGWNQLAFEGLQAVKSEGGIDVTNQVTKSKTDHLPALRDLADQNYDIIICHGFEYGDSVKSIAKDYEKTRFVVVAGNVTQEPNVATIVPKLEDAVYLLGMCGGGLTKSNVMGQIGGMELPVIQSTFEAFQKGGKDVNPKVKVLTNFVGNFEDQGKAKEAARAMLAQDADILFHNADQAGKGMFNAAEESKGVYVFGSNRDQNDLSPKRCLASAVINMPKAFVDLVHDVQNDKFKAEFRELNLKNGTIDVAWNPQLKSHVPPALRKKIEQARQRIKSGSLVIQRKV